MDIVRKEVRWMWAAMIAWTAYTLFTAGLVVYATATLGFRQQMTIDVATTVLPLCLMLVTFGAGHQAIEKLRTRVAELERRPPA